MKPELVELVTMPSAAEAAQLAQQLVRAGIGAVANAEPVMEESLRGGKPRTNYRAFVLVPAADRERAMALLYAEHVPEGAATTAEVDAELADYARRDDEGDADCDRDGVRDDDAGSWQNRSWSDRWEARARFGWDWLLRPALFALGAVFVYDMARCLFG